MLGFAPLSSTPIGALPSVGTYEASGFTSGAFGTPFAVFRQIGVATGFTSGSFGTPTNTLRQQAAGFTTGQFGTPFGTNI